MSKDLLSNMLSTIKNASLVGKATIEVPYSKECESVAKVLEEAGYLSDIKTFKHKGKAYKGLSMRIVYENDLPSFMDVKRVSKPGRRVYKGAHDLGLVKGGRGVSVVSTSRGVMSSVEAKKKKLGGEVLCKVF